jgi:hypothetical protein
LEKEIEMRKILLACLLLVLATSACRLFVPEPNEFPSPPPTIIVKHPIEVTKAPNPPFTPVSGGGYPDAAFKAQDMLAAKLGISADKIEIVKVEPVEWPDSCLGISTPGIMCSMIVTEGYRVILRANTSDYEYHTDSGGNNIVFAGLKPAIVP